MFLPATKAARTASRANAVVTVALGVVDLGIALHEYAQNPNALAERRLVERIVDIALDIGIAFIPTVGPTEHFAWTAFAGIHTLVDPEGAAKTSSLAPSVGGGVRLLFQYVFTNAVPAAMAEEALTLAVDRAVGEANDFLSDDFTSVLILPTE